MKKAIIIIQTILLFFFGGLILLHLMGIVWHSETIFTAHQPKGINYGSYDPYQISIIQQQRTLGSNYIILVSKSAETSYGHVINYPATYVVNEKDMKNAIVNWTNDGVEIETYLNTRIFIPKKNFTRGR